ncbi:hypothetical protein MMC20_005943 [Loxospora ochrophaea]|nr:hypothetical protein [Loxospora ochrophaea]
MASEDGEPFIKVRRIVDKSHRMPQLKHKTGPDMMQNLAQFIRTHEKALANALQLKRQSAKHRPPSSQAGDASPTHLSNYNSSTPTSSTSSTLAAALSLGSLTFTSHVIKPAKLTLTPHHLFYLLSRFEELGILVGSMNVRLENIHADTSPANYVSFLSQPHQSKAKSDRDSIHSVSSVRSVMSGMSSFWSNLGMGSSQNSAKSERAKAQLLVDMKYLYSAFTKIPCLRLSPDPRARLIRGYEEFPFDTAVPLHSFKNLSALEIYDIDFRQFFGWDRLAEQLRSLTVKRAHIDDPTDLLVGVVLDDMDKRRRRSSRPQLSPVLTWPSSPAIRQSERGRADSTPSTPATEDKFGQSASPRNSLLSRSDSENLRAQERPRTKSTSPTRPSSSHRTSSHRHTRSGRAKVKRSGSSSSTSSSHSNRPLRTQSSSNLLSLGILPASKWRFLRHLSIADNGLTSMSASGLTPVASALYSLDLSSNLFVEVPDSLASLVAMRALNLSNCMIDSLHSLARNPLPAITALNLRGNRLRSLAGIERLLSLERLDLRDNFLTDPTEVARLTGIPNIREIWVHGNPFVKTHGNYRVKIFNLFRNTPGYTEDIVIDGSGPGYSERRQLRDRVAEKEGVPIMKPLPAGWDVSNTDEVQKPPERNIEVSDDVQSVDNVAPQSQTMDGEISVRSSHRKKGPRRRIVDLSRDQARVASRLETHTNAPSKKSQAAVSKTLVDNTTGQITTEQKLDTTLGFSTETDSPTKRLPKLETSLAPLDVHAGTSLPDKELSLAPDLQAVDLSGETYRKKIEALKEEFGNGWLGVLSEQGWNGKRAHEIPGPGLDFNHINPGRIEAAHLRATSQGIVSGSRTLG